MATTSARSATAESVIRLLRSAYDPAGFNNTQLDFPVYVANEFLTAMDEGISASALSDLSRRIAAYAAGAFAI